MEKLSRRGLLGALICAPAIVRASSLMPVKALLGFDSAIAEMITYNNSLLTIQMITREAVQHFKDKNAFIKVFRQDYEEIFAANVRIRFPHDV